MKRLLLALALSLATTTAYGDGGTMLLHQDAGPFTLTLFAAPHPLHVGTADISAMVQDRSTGEVLLDPVIDVTLDPGIDVTLKQQSPVRLAAGQASNRLLQGGTVRFSRAGQWNLQVTVRRGQDLARFRTGCTVAADHSRTVLVWFYLLLPVVVIGLFAIHQGLQARRLC